MLQTMPAKSTDPVETVILVPMGATRLRISSFPTVSDSPDAHAWEAPPIAKAAIPAAASHVFDGDTTDALSDGLLPKSSSDESIPRFTWWDRKGSTEWVEYHFPKAKTLSQARVYWFDDSPTGGGCRIPQSWKLMVSDGKKWREVSVHGEYGTAQNKFNTVMFDPVTCKSIRIEAQLKDGFSGGILEWEVR